MLMAHMDKDNNEKIDYLEFYNAIQQHREAAVQTAGLDTRERLVISSVVVSEHHTEMAPALVSAMDSLLEELGNRHEMILEMMERMDKNGDRMLNREELAQGFADMGLKVLQVFLTHIKAANLTLKLTQQSITLLALNLI